jgi:hypothetical protein
LQFDRSNQAGYISIAAARASQNKEARPGIKIIIRQESRQMIPWPGVG